MPSSRLLDRQKFTCAALTQKFFDEENGIVTRIIAESGKAE